MKIYSKRHPCANQPIQFVAIDFAVATPIRGMTIPAITWYSDTPINFDTTDVIKLAPGKYEPSVEYSTLMQNWTKLNSEKN